MAQQIQLRHDTTAQWEYINPTLAVGEIGIDTTTGEFKIGDGNSTWSELDYFSNGGELTLPASIKDTNGDDLIVFEKGGTGVARIHAVQDDLALRSARDIILYPGDDGPGKVYINWGDADYTPNATNEVATLADVDEAVSSIGLNNIKTRIWGYPSDDAVAIMPETDNESIALKSSDAAAIRWHVRNNTGSMQLLSATVNAGDGYEVVFTINEQNSVPAIGAGKYYQINCPNNSDYNGAFIAISATTTTLTFIYESDPGVFDPTDASISQPSVYSQFEVDSDGAHIKIADWTSGPGGYSQQWNFTKEGAIHFPYGPSNNRTGSGDVLRFASSFDQAIITGPEATYVNPTANRLVVAGQDGTAGDGFDGEGGDIYLWAGRGGGTNGDGGDIKVDGGNGQGTGEGGYVKVRGGYSPNGQGGYVNIDAGSSSTGSGGNIQISAGNSFNGENTYGGAVQIYSGQSNTNGLGGNIYLTTQSGGKIFLQPAANHVYVGTESPGNRVAQVEDLAYIRVAVPTSSIGVEGHVEGMVADDGNFHYYCTANYDGTNHVWKRVGWTAGTWGV